MRKIITFLFIGFITICLAACKKDSNAIVIGKWYVKNLTSSSTRNGIEYSKNEQTDFTDKDYYQFNSNGNGTEYVVFQSSDPNYVSIVGNPSIYNFTYSISGSNLSVSPAFNRLEAGGKLTFNKPNSNQIIIDNNRTYSSSGTNYVDQQEMELSK